MKYLIVSLINTIYGILILTTLTQETIGFVFVLFIAGVLIILGLYGFINWLIWNVSATKTAEAPLALKNWYQIIKGIDILLILGIFFRSLILQPFLVEGNSMEPNYHDQEFILVDRLSYRFTKPERGEVIIFKYPKNPQEDYIKRIIALPGETIAVANGQIFINNQVLIEDYLDPQTITNISAKITNNLYQTLNDNEYFVMGDNRGNSSDSRDWGTVPQENLIGRAWFVVYPFKNAGKIENPQINLKPLVSFLPTLSQ